MSMHNPQICTVLLSMLTHFSHYFDDEKMEWLPKMTMTKNDMQ